MLNIVKENVKKIKQKKFKKKEDKKMWQLSSSKRKKLEREERHYELGRDIENKGELPLDNVSKTQSDMSEIIEEENKNELEIKRLKSKYITSIKRYSISSNPTLFKAQLYLLTIIKKLITQIIKLKKRYVRFGRKKTLRYIVETKVKLNKKKEIFLKLKKTENLRKYGITDELAEEIRQKYGTK